MYHLEHKYVWKQNSKHNGYRISFIVDLNVFKHWETSKPIKDL